MGFNQHTRGAWVNNADVQRAPADRQDLRARQLAVLAHRPALGLRHRARSRHLRPPPARRHGRQQRRAPRDLRNRLGHSRRHHPGASPASMPCCSTASSRTASSTAYWVQCTNNMQAAPNMNDEGYPGYRNPDNFIIVSDPYPTVTALAADLILPTAMWVEKEGAYGNAERRTQFWREQVSAPGEAKSDVWQVMEFSKRFTTDEVWPAELLDTMPELKGKTLFEVLFANGKVNSLPGQRSGRRLQQPREHGFRLLRAERPVRGIRRVWPRPCPRPAPTSTPITRPAGCAGRWSTARKRCGASARAMTPTSRKARA